ncbi:MAG: hypothetical protein ABI405_09720, partial [Parafilimonas sp.]
MKIKLALIFSHLLFAVFMLHAQKGLLHNNIYSIAETSEGFMCLVRRIALTGFDGKNFININWQNEKAILIRAFFAMQH